MSTHPSAAARPPVLLDPLGRRLFAEAAELRAAGPAVRVRLPENLTAWSVTRGDVVRTLLNHPDVSRDARHSWPGYEPGAVAWISSFVDTVSMLTTDGADHARLRRLVGSAFSARRVEALRPAIEALVAELIEGLARRTGGEPVDLRAAFSYQVPTRVICDLFGVPGEQRPDMLALVDSIVNTGASLEAARLTSERQFLIMERLLEYKRAHPGDDMTSQLVNLQAEDGDRLSGRELLSTLVLMIGAGSETTVSLIDHAVVALLTHPGQLAEARRDEARWADVIEEALRAEPPVMHVPLRFATADIDLGEGVTIAAGDLILIAFGAHGRDPAVHADPESFSIDREDKQHLAFGHGIHFCLGAPLARLEASIALPALFDAFPRIHLAADPASLERNTSLIVNDYRALPVHLS
ncbi:cytochrome P450 [Streptomyces sp. DSM 44917]|uniref:Cytochrome P450 n=1 Tax=Streptomyces boetiae TaxID=3075541 RepID=A0ABU2LD61_9ACTN|nr:cytochrome P450 [Streptomyces sp. DSM 44917]MDT0309513.1 cytochrome P450 [Streptomyces sp. DSM 44917]